MTARKSVKKKKQAKAEARDSVNTDQDGLDIPDTPGLDATDPVSTTTEAENIVEVDIDPLAVMTTERDQYKDKWLRAVAEQENLRKRTRREITDAHTFTRVEIIRGLLEVLDNFDRAQASLPEDAAGHSEFSGFVGGVQLVHDRLRTILESYGLKKIAASKGDQFDPILHEAVASVEDPDIGDGAILAVARVGYKMGEIVVRPAQVMVAK